MLSLKTSSRIRCTYSAGLGICLLLSLPMFLFGCESVSEIESTSNVGPQSAPIHEPITSIEVAASCVSGRQTRGSLYEICLPESADFNGSLIVYARGFAFPQIPLHIPEVEGGVDVADFILSKGYAYAATSFYKNGVIDVNKGVEDLLELVEIYQGLYGDPDHTLLLGFSNGSFLSTIAMEKHPNVFDGALASCGPVGSYRAAVDYLTDVFVLFDFFFGDVEVVPGAGLGIPGGPDGIPSTFLAHLDAIAPPGFTAVDVLLQSVVTALTAHPSKTEQLLGTVQLTSSISRNTALFQSVPEGVELVVGAVLYSVFVSNDGLDVFRGRYFENRDRLYGDLHPDPAMPAFVNSSIPRYAADTNVLAQLNNRYESKGHLRGPVVALHNIRDPRVPFWQEQIYLEDLARNAFHYEVQTIQRYGHCNFTEEEVTDGLDLLMSKVIGPVAAF